MRQKLTAVAWLFLRLGFTAFGGPAAHVAMMHREAVRRRGWVDEQRFLDHVGLTNLIPGPNSTELSMLLGAEHAGPAGLVVAGACFIVPAALVVLVLAWFYVRYGTSPAGEALLYGIKPVVIAIVVQAIFSLGAKALRGVVLIALGVAACALFLLGINELVILFGGAAVVVAVGRGRSVANGVVAIGLSAAGAARSVVRLDDLFLVFLKIGALLYGSGYVLLAFLQADLVDRLGWISRDVLLDAVSIGQVTPGPLFTTATFIGYVVAEFPGALVATAGIFLPSFLFAAVVIRLAPRFRSSEVLGAFLDGVNASALGLMGGVTIQLARAAFVDIPTILLGAAAAAVLIRFDLNSAWLVLGGALAGLAIRALA